MLPCGGPISKSFVVLAVSWVASVDSVAEFWSWNESWVIFTKFFRSLTSAESSLKYKKKCVEKLPISMIISVKPFKSKNRDKIDLGAPNPNLKKGSDRDFRATVKPINYYVGL